jgi:hypothetical protein
VLDRRIVHMVWPNRLLIHSCRVASPAENGVLDAGPMLPPHTAELVDRQLGLATRRQLLDGGVTEAQIRWAVGRGWRVVLPRVLLLDAGLPSAQQRLMAALLLAGPDSWFAAPTAAVLHALPGCRITPPVHVLVPPHRTTRTVGWVRMSRTYLLDERLVSQGPLRVSCRPQALVDAAAACPDDAAVRALFIDAIHSRLVRLDDVAHWVEARESDGRRRLRRALAEAATGVWSVPEADLMRLMTGDGRLPEPWANPTLRDADGRRLTTPDLWFDDVALAVMVHSRRYHAGALDWEATVTDDEELRSAGIEVVTVTPVSIVSQPDDVLQRVHGAYQRAKGRLRPMHVAAERRLPTWGVVGAALVTANES